MELPISNPVFASLLFSETAFKTNVEKIIDRFVVDAAYANDVMSKELELKKTHVATVNAFITVAAFIAGVQAQIIAFTFGLNDTHIQTVTNGIGFIGLTFDVLGTSFGLLFALSLQKSIRQSRVSLHANTIQHTKARVQLLMGRISSSANLHTDANCLRIAQLLNEEMMHRRRFWRYRLKSNIRPADKCFLEHRDLILGEEAKIVQWEYNVLLEGAAPEQLFALARIPVIAMGLGIACLLISVICFASYTQNRQVWLACVIVATITAGYSFYCLLFVEIAGVVETLYIRNVKQNDETFIKLQELSQRLNSKSNEGLNLSPSSSKHE
jgi:hypothetical protein